MTRPILALAAAVLAIAPLDARQQIFRAATHAVALDVAVFDGDSVVAGLGPGDFDVFDNGVAQRVTAVETNVLPIDLRLVFDLSGSITENELRAYLRGMRQVTTELRPDDRCEILTFNARVSDAAIRQRPPISINLSRGGIDGTAFFDAVSLALITTPTPDRRQIVIVLSDAQDNASFFDEATLLEAARRTDAVVYTIVPGDVPGEQTPYVGRLQALSLLTGGRVIRTQRDSIIGTTLVRALEEFRRSYVVRYSLAGVPVPGWHKLLVKIRTQRGYRVRARDGYFGR